MTDETLTSRRRDLVLALLRDNRYQPMRPREMAGLLGVPKSERGELGAILDSLCAEGLASVDGYGRYSKASRQTAEGIFTANERGFGFVTVDGEDADWFIPAEETADAIDGQTSSSP